MDPAKDALPGSCREFVGVHSVLDAAGPKGGIALGVVDSPLVELGAMVDERPSAIGIRQWKQEPYAGTTVHAFLLNNYWHTNYKAEQQGVLRFRFALRPHGVEPPGEVVALSRDLEQPLVVLPHARVRRRTELKLDADPAVQVVGLRPAGEGAALVVRLLNASDRRQAARVGRGAPVSLGPWEVATARVD
jgi:hypothetical protein